MTLKSVFKKRGRREFGEGGGEQATRLVEAGGDLLRERHGSLSFPPPLLRAFVLLRRAASRREKVVGSVCRPPALALG